MQTISLKICWFTKSEGRKHGVSMNLKVWQICKKIDVKGYFERLKWASGFLLVALQTVPSLATVDERQKWLAQQGGGEVLSFVEDSFVLTLRQVSSSRALLLPSLLFWVSESLFEPLWAKPWLTAQLSKLSSGEVRSLLFPSFLASPPQQPFWPLLWLSLQELAWLSYLPSAAFESPSWKLLAVLASQEMQICQDLPFWLMHSSCSGQAESWIWLCDPPLPHRCFLREAGSVDTDSLALGIHRHLQLQPCKEKDIQHDSYKSWHEGSLWYLRLCCPLVLAHTFSRSACICTGLLLPASKQRLCESQTQHLNCMQDSSNFLFQLVMCTILWQESFTLDFPYKHDVFWKTEYVYMALHTKAVRIFARFKFPTLPVGLLQAPSFAMAQLLHRRRSDKLYWILHLPGPALDSCLECKKHNSNSPHAASCKPWISATMSYNGSLFDKPQIYSLHCWGSQKF